MESVVAGELRMERRDRHHALSRADNPRRTVDLDTGKWLDSRTEPIDRRGSDEHRMHRSLEISDVDIGLERLRLATECVSADRDVDGAKGPLVGATVEHLVAEQYHPGAGAKGWHARGETIAQRHAQPGGVDQHQERRRLPARDNDGVDRIEIGWKTNKLDGSPESLERRHVFGDVTLEGEDTDTPGRAR
jgi:hypothetical protein